MTLTFQASVVFVQDIVAPRRFYEELLGQEVEMDRGASTTFKGGLALWQVEHAFQTIYERTPDSTEQPGRQEHELHFETTDAKATSSGFWRLASSLYIPSAKCPGASASSASAIPTGVSSL
jgi:hypothetical protein